MRRTFVLAGVLVLAGCSSGAIKPTAAPTSQAGTATSSTTTPIPAAAAADLTGFGATKAEWDAHHTADTSKTAAGYYNPDPALGDAAPVGVDDDYDAVGIDDNGRVDYYGRLFSARPLAAALDVVKAELPADAVLGPPITTSSRAGSCLHITATSVTAGTVLGGPAGSRIEVELQSWNSKILDKSAIASASIASANRSDALAC